MKKFIRIISVVLALTIGASVLTACGGNENNQSESTSSQIELVE